MASNQPVHVCALNSEEDVTAASIRLAPAYEATRWRWGGGNGKHGRIPDAAGIAEVIRYLKNLGKYGSTGGLTVEDEAGVIHLYCAPGLAVHLSPIKETAAS